MPVTRYIGDAMVINSGTIDISAEYSSVTVSNEQAGKERIEVTDKSDVSGGKKTYVPGLRGEPKATITVECSDTKARASNVKTQLLSGTAAALTWYPEGKIHGNAKYSVTSAELVKKDFKSGVKDKTAWTLTYESYEEVAEGTYSSVQGGRAA